LGQAEPRLKKGGRWAASGSSFHISAGSEKGWGVNWGLQGRKEETDPFRGKGKIIKILSKIR